MIGIHRHDVLVTRDGPVTAEYCAARSVHRGLFAQALEVMAYGIVFEQRELAGVDLLQCHGVGHCARGLVQAGSGLNGVGQSRLLVLLRGFKRRGAPAAALAPNASLLSRTVW